MQEILRNPAYHDALAIIKGFRNGAVYGKRLIVCVWCVGVGRCQTANYLRRLLFILGAKIRFPHALVMTFLFREGRYYC